MYWIKKILGKKQNTQKEAICKSLDEIYSKMNCFPQDDSDMTTYQRGLYDGYLNSYNIIKKHCKK